MPAYNAGRYIAKAIDSVLAQTLQDWELIIVDDGSTDDTFSIVAAYSDPRIRCLHQQNQGPAAARNRGVQHSDGQFLAFLDADDWWDQHCLESLLATLEVQTEQYAVAHCDWAYASDDGGIGAKQSSQLAHGHVLTTLVLRNPFVIHAALVRRAAVLAVGGFPTERPALEDWEFWLRLAIAGHRFVHLPKLLAYYYWRPGSRSKDANARKADRLATLERLWGGHNHSPEVLSFQAESFATAYIDFCVTDFAFGDDDTAFNDFSSAISWSTEIAVQVDTYYRMIHAGHMDISSRHVEQVEHEACERNRGKIENLLAKLEQYCCTSPGLDMAHVRSAAYWAIGLTCYQQNHQREAQHFMTQSLKLAPTRACSPKTIYAWGKSYLPVPLLNWCREMRHQINRSVNFC
jgi:hypothetical protein